MQNFKRVKLACYGTNVTMAIVSNLSPILFLTFHNKYDISYTLLGTLVLINFVTQLSIDLIFSFFSHKFNIPLAVKITPILSVIGLVLYALAPIIFPSTPYLGLVIGTVIFSASCGFAEVLISPVIAAIPSDNPEREMSKLHSIYAWGVVGMIAVSTLFLALFSDDNWQWLAALFAVAPIFASVLFMGARLPKLETPEKVSGSAKMLKNRSMWLFVFAIFLGGAAECTMAQWCSSYIEGALGIPKVWGDLLGAACFAAMLGLGRTLYAKRGRNVEWVLLIGAIGATICYMTAALSPFAWLALIACALTGLCVSMMWPGSLVVASEKFPNAGVFLYAMMAAGGDLGVSVGPQLVGIISDSIPKISFFQDLSNKIGITAEQLGLRVAILVGMLISFIAIFVFLHIYIKRNKSL